MGEQARCVLRIIVFIVCTGILTINSATANTYKNAMMSQLDGDNLSRNHLDLCCLKVNAKYILYKIQAY